MHEAWPMARRPMRCAIVIEKADENYSA